MFDPLPGVGGGLYGFPPTRGDQAETGPLSVLVPTAPAVLFELHRRFGRLSFEAVTEPAIRLAEEGFVSRLGVRSARGGRLPPAETVPGGVRALYARGRESVRALRRG